MKHQLLIIFALLAFVIPVSIASAAAGLDDLGGPNDPKINDRANACFEGGSMAGKCDTEWEWTCGWYLIRYNEGIYSRSKVPVACASLLPGEKVTNPWPPAGCYYSAVYGLYIFWNGNQTQNPPIDMTWDGTCATPPHTGVGGFFLVSAPDAKSAAAICTTKGYTYIDEVSSTSDTKAWAIYRCQVP